MNGRVSYAHATNGAKLGFYERRGDCSPRIVKSSFEVEQPHGPQPILGALAPGRLHPPTPAQSECVLLTQGTMLV
jgi:hypothetical protein